MEYPVMTMSLFHQRLTDKADGACCWGSGAHGWCSKCSPCKLKAAFSGFPTTDFRTEPEQTKHLCPSPKMESMGDKHRCTRFSCPINHHGRSPREVLSTASAAVVTPEMLELYAHGSVQQLLQHVRQQTGGIMFGDGGHVCRRFPCPDCGNGNGRSTALEVEVIGC